MYLSHEFLNWIYGESEGSGVDFEKLNRAHEIWRHAKNRIKETQTEFDKIDCITSLKRSINSRLKTITKEYGLNELPNTRKKKQILEKFQDYGLIRTAFLQDLFELRNLLEHEDITPPSIDKCNYYIDIVWYFLKSTDSLLLMKIDCLSYEHESNNELNFRIKPESNWEVSMFGRVNKAFLSESKVDGWLELQIKEIEPVGKSDDYVRFSATPVITNEILLPLARDYFGAKGYWFEDHA
jgi:hypothetical protein